MNTSIPRLRMFAGPNGSGKSTFKTIIRQELLGVYINPDEIEKEIREFSFLDLDAYYVKRFLLFCFETYLGMFNCFVEFFSEHFLWRQGGKIFGDVYTRLMQFQ